MRKQLPTFSTTNSYSNSHLENFFMKNSFTKKNTQFHIPKPSFKDSSNIFLISPQKIENGTNLENKTPNGSSKIKLEKINRNLLKSQIFTHGEEKEMKPTFSIS